MKFLKKTPLFLLLLPLFFCLHAALENIENIRFITFFNISIFILLGITTLYLLLKLITKSWGISAIVCFYIAIWYLFFGAIHDTLRSIPFLFWLQKYSILLPFLFFSTIALAWFLKKKNYNFSKLFLFFNFLLIIYCIIDIVSIQFKKIPANFNVEKVDNFFKTELVKTKPNVYFLLFDGYPGYKSLNDSFGYKNDSLYHFLKERNFNIEPTFSNYNYTFYSLSSMLNLNYVKSKIPNDGVTMDDLNERNREIKNAKLISIFDSMHYDIKNFSLYDFKNKPGVGYAFSLNIGNAQLITDKMLHARFIKNIGWVFITGKYSIPFLKNKFDDQYNAYNRKVESNLNAHLLVNSTTPQFVYLHFLLPHWPYYYDEKGVFDANATMFDESTYSNKTKFIGYLKYTNNKMESYVNQILQKDSNAIIICMSDHGFRDYNNAINQMPIAVFDNFCAIRFPNKNYLTMKDKWSNVNTFRYLLNAQFNQQISYLKDTSIFLKNAGASKTKY